ncbi:hypothetical protein Sango_0562700 [Sesamum angolense]|uniref:BTB domain-containing protein n=1 Tax=Sesamum angolense TaxID=2727404 RepID=A0AAE1X573_9LAMI|nr:hypothetical protein Sango_0562700 [Sesamum angolense]
MLQGPWKEASAPVLTLHVDDKNVNGEAMEIALAYLYGHYPKLNDNNAFRVLAAASFLDLQDLCEICTDFIIAELWSSNFLTYQVFAESQDYGIHGERVRNACWGYLCQSGAPKTLLSNITGYSPQTNYGCPVKRNGEDLICTVRKSYIVQQHQEQGSSSCEVVGSISSDSPKVNRKHLADERTNELLETGRGRSKSKDEFEGHNAAHSILFELADSIVDSHSDFANYDQAQTSCNKSNLESRYNCNSGRPSASNAFYADDTSASSSYLNVHIGVRVGMSGSAGSGLASEGPSDEESGYQLNSSWSPGDQMQCKSMNSSCNVLMPNEWEKCNISPLTWGGRIVGRREMLLSQRVHEIGADTCKSCSLVSMACACRQPFGYSRAAPGYYVQDHDHNNLPANDVGHVYITSSAQGERNGLFRPVRVHDRGPIDGLAGIGRGTTSVPVAAWPPTRYVFSRVPFGIGNRSNQQPPANDDPENRADNNGDLAGDGLTALVGLSQGSNDVTNLHEVHMGREYETGLQCRLAGSLTPRSSPSCISVQMVDSPERSTGIEWENSNSSISLDMKTPLSHFPPFRFAVEFHDVHRLTDGQVKHSPEVFYAGSSWKISVQAFSDEDPQGRTLGLFLHRRKAEISDPLRKLHMYVDSREKVTARYQVN